MIQDRQTDDACVRCIVTGHDNGPLCSECGRPTDTIEVTADGQGLGRGEKGYFCFRCLAEGVAVEVAFKE